MGVFLRCLTGHMWEECRQVKKRISDRIFAVHWLASTFSNRKPFSIQLIKIRSHHGLLSHREPFIISMRSHQSREMRQIIKTIDITAHTFFTNLEMLIMCADVMGRDEDGISVGSGAIVPSKCGDLAYKVIRKVSCTKQSLRRIKIFFPSDL